MLIQISSLSEPKRNVIGTLFNPCWFNLKGKTPSTYYKKLLNLPTCMVLVTFILNVICFTYLILQILLQNFEPNKF